MSETTKSGHTLRFSLFLLVQLILEGIKEFKYQEVADVNKNSRRLFYEQYSLLLKFHIKGVLVIRASFKGLGLVGGSFYLMKRDKRPITSHDKTIDRQKELGGPLATQPSC